MEYGKLKGVIVSIPPFDPKVHLRHFHDAIIQVADNKISKMSVAKREYIMRVLNDSVGIWDEKISMKDYTQLKYLNSKTKRVVDEFAKTIILENSSPEDRDEQSIAELSQTQRKLHQEVDLVETALKMEQVNEKFDGDIDRVISDPEGRQLFKQLIEAKDPWALTHLVERAHSDLVLEIVNEIMALPDSQERLSIFIKTCLSKDFRGGILEVFKKTILDWEMAGIEKVFESVIQISLDLNPGGLTLLYEVIDGLQLENRALNAILDPVVLLAIDDDKPNEVMQSILMVFVTELDPNHPASMVIRDLVKDFDAVDFNSLKNKYLYFKRLDFFSENIELKEVYDSRMKTYVKGRWSDYSLKLRLCSKLMHLERDRAFIRFALSSLRSGPSNVQPSSKCFPPAEGLMIGCTRISPYFAPHIARQLNVQSEVSIYSPACRSEPVVKIPEITLLEGDEDAVKWLQDPFMTGLNIETGKAQFLFPRFTHPADLPVLEFSIARSTRVRAFLSTESRELAARFTPAKMSVMGRITSRGEQLILFDQIMQNMDSLRDMKCTMTFFEGGNILVGRDQNEEAYVIIGADLIEMNRKLLLRDMKQLGVVKGPDGISVEGARVDLYDDAMLSDQEVCAYIAKDLGLKSADQVFIVEQPDYHLDMAMTIMGNLNGTKTVVLNDSMMAAAMYRSLLEIDKVRLDADAMKELEKIQKEAELISAYERNAEVQLKQQGFAVIRVPGRFKALEERKNKRSDVVNFFNFVSATLRPKGSRVHSQDVVIAMGSTPQYQQMFIEMFKKTSDKSIDEIQFHFLDPDKSKELLRGNGGINCITKILEGKL